MYDLLYELFSDGHITTKELGTVLRSLGQNPTDTELQHLINQGNDILSRDDDNLRSIWVNWGQKRYIIYHKIVDYNRNGVIEFDEFVDLMMRDYETIDYKADIYAAFRYEKP